MPKSECDNCKGSGFNGVAYVKEKIDDECAIETLELIKCKAGCKDGYIFIVDDSSYDKETHN